MNAAFIRRWVGACATAAVIAPGQAAAQVPAARTPDPVGRLFFTPAQRASLDVARTQRARAALATDRNAEDAAPQAQTITYGGMVRRSDGKSTVWINGRSVNDNDPAGGASVVGRVRADGSISLQVPQTGRGVELKPGQSIELLSGTIEEGYSRKPAVSESRPATTTPADAKAEKPAPADAAKAARDREEQDQQRLQDAIRAVQDANGARPPAAPPSEGPAR